MTRGDWMEGRIVELLRERGPMPMRRLYASFDRHRGRATADELKAALSALAERGTVASRIVGSGPPGGRPSTVWSISVPSGVC